MSAAVFAFAECKRQAGELAKALGIAANPIEVHKFPDGESLVRVRGKASTALLFRSLDDPNSKLIELLLASSALRDLGAERIILVAPYLAYMRQDKAFHDGEAVSQQVIGKLLADWIDALVTVDPHLHRTANLGDAVGTIPAAAVSAAPALVQAIGSNLDPRTILIGPDAESRPWVESIATPLGLETLIGVKSRTGDREVTLTLPGIGIVQDRPALLVDDMVSSGTTLMVCARLLHEAGAASVEAVVTHSLATADDLAKMTSQGITRLRATDSTSNPIATIPLAEVLADAIRVRAWLG